MIINGTEWKFGADPETFMGKGNSLVAAHTAIQGSKEEPFAVPLGAVQVDGLALEFNIDPVLNKEDFINNINGVMGTLKGMIGDNDFIQDTSVFFDEAFLKDIPTIHKVLGCSEDYNGWTLEANDKPDSNLNMRTAGGHAHIGGFFSSNAFDYEHYLKGARLSRILDETLGVYSILWDKDDMRRSMYGAAGSFRPKTYGMEYRTLSNSWIFKDELKAFVFDSIVEAIELFGDPDYQPDPCVEMIINSSDRTNTFFDNNIKANFVRSL